MRGLAEADISSIFNVSEEKALEIALDIYAALDKFALEPYGTPTYGDIIERIASIIHNRISTDTAEELIYAGFLLGRVVGSLDTLDKIKSQFPISFDLDDDLLRK